MAIITREQITKRAGCGHQVTYLLADGTTKHGRECNERVIARPAPALCTACQEGKSRPKA